jgi:hypothetical protein
MQENLKEKICWSVQRGEIQQLPARLIFLLAALLFYGYAVAQSKTLTVSGVITDRQNNPIAGATIVVKGSVFGTISNVDGKYTLSDVPNDGALVFSFIGMKKTEVPINGQTRIDIALEEETVGLEEVIAVGYGVQKKATLSGAVEQITSKSLESRAITNVALALQGETPGLIVTRSSPRPGNEGIKFQIRGATSVNGEPLC